MRRIKQNRPSYSREYFAWRNMRNRCSWAGSPKYSRYGGRGITVCERWQLFANFLEDMGICPEGMSLDRIDNDGNYEPGNCRWTDRLTQAANSKSSMILTLNGVSKPKSAWARDIGILPCSLDRRLRTWSLEDALTRPKTGVPRCAA